MSVAHGALAGLRLHDTLTTGGTSKQKIDGTLADTRLGKFVTTRWLNERFRQTMLLLREFAVNWSTGTLLSTDDLQYVRVCLDVALAQAEPHERELRKTQRHRAWKVNMEGAARHS